MDWYTVIKIGILIFGLISWILYKGERGVNRGGEHRVNRAILEKHLSQREPIRDLTDEELELLHPYLTSKITVYPYKSQSSLIDNHVSYLRGECYRNSFHSNTDEITYYYEVDNIELFFPYSMDRYIDKFNIIEVVFTKWYGIVVKINDHDIKTASENYGLNEEYEFGDLKNTNLLDDRDSVDIESLTLYDDNKKVDKQHNTNRYQKNNSYGIGTDSSEASINQTLYQREERGFEAISQHNLGILTSLCLILATVLLIQSWFSENEQISILILILVFLSAAAFFVWYKPKRHLIPQQVKVIKAKISNTFTEMGIGDNGRKLLRYGHTLSVNNEIEQFGSPKFIIRNTILFIVGIVLSAVLYYFTDPINNGYFAYRYYNQQSHNLQINDLTTLENSDISQGDIVNISIKNTSCDVNNLKVNYKCHHFFINTQPMTLTEDNVMSINSSLKHIFDPKFVNDFIDLEMTHLKNMQQEYQLYIDMLNKHSIERVKFYVKKSFSRIKNIGQIIIDIEKVCKITPLENCDNIKSRIVKLFDSDKDGITWDDLLDRSEKNPEMMNEIVESNEVNVLKINLKPFKLELQKKLVKIVSQYQSENSIEITLTNQSYIDMLRLVMNNSIKLDEFENVNYYIDILNNTISPNVNIIGVVSDIRYREDQNSNTKSISALKVNANHHYNLKANQPLSPLFLINMLIFVVMTLTATINGIQLLRKIIINRHRTSEIKKYYEKRLGTIINL